MMRVHPGTRTPKQDNIRFLGTNKDQIQNLKQYNRKMKAARYLHDKPNNMGPDIERPRFKKMQLESGNVIKARRLHEAHPNASRAQIRGAINHPRAARAEHKIKQVHPNANKHQIRKKVRKHSKKN